jgi:hypothetical protein
MAEVVSTNQFRNGMHIELWAGGPCIVKVKAH